MVTAESVKAKLGDLISRINDVTGRSDATLTEAVVALAAGFGQSGGTGVQTGSLIPAEELSSITLQVQGICSNLVIWRVSQELIDGKRVLYRFVEVDRSVQGTRPFWHTLSSNSTGTALNNATYADGGCASFTDGQISLTWNGGAYGWGVLSAGAEYLWMAW